ncbi:MAG: four helix bundle protein [Fimbriimonadaceae bacterium]
MRDYRKLEVWQIGIDFATEVYRRTASFPKEELYGLTSQLRRAVVSIPANIAEGSGRDTDAELLRFVRIALGSLNEVETLFEVARRIGYLEQKEIESQERESRDLGVRLRNLAQKLDSDIRQKNLKQ